MNLALVIIVALLLVAAIAIQLFYLHGLARSGVEITRSTKVISYANIAMLVVLFVVLLAAALSGNLPIMDAR